MATKLYVGGIPYSATNEDLKNHFAQAGEVLSATIILDKMHNNRSKGFGFVEMANDDEAQKAISMFHDNDFDGRTLTVNVAKPMEDRPRRDFDGPRNRRSM